MFKLSQNKFKILLVVSILLLSIFSFNVDAKVKSKDISVDTSVNISRTITDAPPKVKNNKFTYTITPDSSNPGIATGYTESFDIEFKNINAGNAIAILDKTINFNNVTFSNPGDYKFKVKETASSDEVSYPLATDNWEIDIVVRYNTVGGVPTNELVIKSFIVIDKNNNEKSDSGIKFSADANFTSIRIFNDTEGNMANLNRYFKLRLYIYGEEGDTYTIEGQDSTVKYGGETINTSTIYTVGDTPQYIYLKDNQDITVGKRTIVTSSEVRKRETVIQKEIKIGTDFKLEEMGSEAYKTYFNGSNTPSKISPKMTTGENVATIRVLNVYDADIMTGVMLKVLPYILLLIVAALIFVLIRIKGKKEE